jgi:hypothetical protein
MKINSFLLLINIFLIYSKCNCESVIVKGVEINYTYDDRETDYVVKFPLKSFVGSDSYWGALGLNSVPQMVLF